MMQKSKACVAFFFPLTSLFWFISSSHVCSYHVVIVPLWLRRTLLSQTPLQRFGKKTITVSDVCQHLWLQ